jgi:hypothetical protein
VLLKLLDDTVVEPDKRPEAAVKLETELLLLFCDPNVVLTLSG